MKQRKIFGLSILLLGACFQSPILLGQAAAAYSGHTEIVRLLLNHGADPEALTRYGGTPLGDAVSEGHAEG